MEISEALHQDYEPQGMWRSRRPAVRLVTRLLLAQLGVGAAIAGLWLLDSGWSALAAATGMAIAVVPSAYFAAHLFSKAPGTAPRAVVRAFYLGEVVKLILTAALFMIALRWFGGHFLPLITTYAAVLGTYWFFFLGALRT
ncbi:MAG: ATP synthase subunit I [Halorhodospira sp.]